MTAATPGTPQAIVNKEKAVQALALRKTGATYEQIAQALGYASRGAAHRAVQRLLKAHEVEEVDALRKLEDSRLDEMLFAITRRRAAATWVQSTASCALPSGAPGCGDWMPAQKWM